MEAESAVRMLSGLGQETRLAAFLLLVEAGPAGLTAGAIARKLKLLPATLSFHLTKLCEIGLAKARPEGSFVYYSAQFAEIEELMKFLGENCVARNARAP